ncbi:DUF4097 family beta strand repeat-containing protein [Halalkalibacter urbisdiaboli]|uniref:DUF4097 family beta strand repeat-containing protein n=1 Tax=Halalkalibacter urbisdiaboli TaxID=1960589 RepID=UPI000B43D294|nr:DUF4097 family beta strand repeat-containing protein [Halalkalibacter urbisdiaboli]
MKKRLWAAVPLTVAILTGCNLVTYEEEEVLALPSEGITTFEIQHEEGDVTILGEPGLEEIEVQVIYSVVGEEMADAEAFKQNNTNLDFKTEGEKAVLNSKIKRGTQEEQGSIHLNIRVPDHLIVNHQQKEGKLIVQSLSNDITIQHGRGDIEIANLTGSLHITDGSGTITIERATGLMSIHNSAGTLNMTESTGELSIVAGSGHAQVTHFEGPVSIRSGSGDIEIKEITGDVLVLGNTSGKLNIENVSGTITKP